MKYLAIIILAILGLIELILRALIVVCTMLLVVLWSDFGMKPWCFQMAERILNESR